MKQTSGERGFRPALPNPDAAPMVDRGARSNLWVVVFASLGFVFVDIGAQIYLIELMSLLICLHVFLSRNRVMLPVVLVVGIQLWFFGTILSDLVNESAVVDGIKGLARIITLVVLLVAIRHVVGGSASRILSLWFGTTISLVLAILVLPNPYFSGEPWKFGYAHPVSLLVVVLVSWRGGKFAVPAMFALAVINFAMGSRSLAIITMVSLLILLLRARRATRSGGVRLFVIGIAATTAAVGIVLVYDRLALAGVFGDARRLRADYQSTGNFGAFLTGRGEAFFSVRSIIESPLAGVGSYSLPPQDVIDDQVSFLLAEGHSSVAENYLSNGLQSFHSELLGAIAENGLLAAPFWLAVGALFVWALSRVVSGAAVYPQLVAYLSVLGLWDLLFSPFGADRRFWLAASIITVLVLCKGSANESVYRHHKFQSGRISETEPAKR